MVTARGARARRLAALVLAFAGTLACFRAAHAQASLEAPDTSEVEALAREDAWSEAGGEAGLVGNGARDDGPRDEGARGDGVRGRFLAARGGYAMWSRAALPGRRVELEGLAAREPGETRALDDAYARATLHPARAWTVALGRVDPRAGAGLVLGPARLRPRAPGRLVRGAPVGLDRLVPATPARAATSARGAWIEGGRGRTRVAFLAAATRRDATSFSGLLVPRAGVRHVRAGADTVRERLHERLVALAVSRERAWLVVCRRDGDRFRAASGGASQAVLRASPVVGVGTWIEAGFGGGDPDRSQLALARDPRGRLAFAFAVEPRAAPPAPRAALTVDVRDPRYAGPQGRAESRPYAHAGVALASGPARDAWRVEAHVLARRPYEPVLAWLGARCAIPGGGWLDMRRDAAPPRTVFGFGRGAVSAFRWRGELRFDRRGLARERWVARADCALPGRLRATLEAALGGGRGASGFVDAGVPGGAWVALGSGEERTRVTLAWRGRVAPALTWIATDDVGGPRSAARLAVDFGGAAPVDGPGDGP